MSKQEDPDVFSNALLGSFVKSNEWNAIDSENFFQREEIRAAKQRVRQRKVYQNMGSVMSVTVTHTICALKEHHQMNELSADPDWFSGN